jgi:5-methylcytosine-specific restriction enzyme subunit McrC
MIDNNFFHIRVYEYEWLRIDRANFYGRMLPVNCYTAMCSYYENGKVPYFTLIHNGVKFKEYVGVIQIGHFTIEVVPKADKSAGKGDEHKWQNILINILKLSGKFPVETPTSTNLKLKKNNILELYINLFLKETQKLVHQGLIKKYKKTVGNLNSLKGRLIFNKQFQENLVHAERFYSSYTIYNQIIYKVLEIIPSITNSGLEVSAKQLQLCFPEMDQIQVTEKLFDKLSFDRRSERYRSILAIAKLLLLNFHPDIRQGKNHVLALMFDMNKLWENYVIKCLKKASTRLENTTINGQLSMEFWNGRYIRPDIIILSGNSTYIVDTKWKVLESAEPSIEDVRQMYAYNHHFKASKSILLYPDVFKVKEIYSDYKLPNLYVQNDEIHGCGVMFVNVLNTFGELNRDIGEIMLEKILANR